MIRGGEAAGLFEAAALQLGFALGEVSEVLGVDAVGLGAVASFSSSLLAVRDGQGRATRIRSAYLVGADGATSFVRGVIGQNFTGQTYAFSGPTTT